MSTPTPPKSAQNVTRKVFDKLQKDPRNELVNHEDPWATAKSEEQKSASSEAEHLAAMAEYKTSASWKTAEAMVEQAYKEMNLAEREILEKRDQRLPSFSSPLPEVMSSNEIPPPDAASTSDTEEYAFTTPVERERHPYKAVPSGKVFTGDMPASHSVEGSSRSAEPTHNPSPHPSPQPQGPQSPAMQQLEILSTHLHDVLIPLAERFITSPPSNQQEREHLLRRISEQIMNEFYLKVDRVETEGDPEARALRKGLVREAQGVLNGMDNVIVLK